MAVQYDSEKGWSSWLSVFKNQLKDVSEETTHFFQKMSDIGAHLTHDSIQSMIDSNVFDDYIKGQGLADESLIKFLTDAKYGKKDLESYQQYLKDTGGGISAFTTFTKKASTALKSLGAAMASMAVNWAIGKVIDLIATGIDKFGNASKHAAENAKALVSEMNKSISSISSNSSTLSDLNDEYQKLSKGVNKLGENVSLSTDDYSRYKEIISQVSSIMPNMTTYFNSQGEKIAFAKGELKDLNKEYENYIHNQAIEYVANGDSEGHKIQDILDDYNNNESLKGFEKFWKDLKASAGFVNIEDFTTKEIIRELEKLEEATSIDEILVKLTYKTRDGLRPDLRDHDSALKYIILNELGLTGKTRDELESMAESEYNVLMQKINSYIQSYKARITSDMNQVQTALFQEVYSKESFWAIDDVEVKNDIITFFSSIDSDIWDALNIQTDNDLSVFVNKIIESLSENKDGFSDAWNGLFNPELEDLPVNEYAQQIDNFIKTICKTLELDETDGIRILKVSLGFEDVDTIAANYRSVMREAAKKFADKTPSRRESRALYDAELDELIKFAEENSINTQDEIAFWNKCIEESETREEAMEKYLESPFADDAPISFSSVLSDESLSKFQTTINSLKSSLTTLYNGDYSSTDLISSLSNINKALSDIGKADVLNWEEITNIDDLDNVIDQITNEYVDGMLESLDMAGTEFGDTIRNVIQEELKASRQLETYKSNVSDLQTAYSDLTDVIETYNANGYITFDQLTSLLEMEPQYLSCLIDEAGQLQLNEQAMADLAQLRLDEARAQVVQETISELNRLSEEKHTQAVNDNSNAYIQNIKTISEWNNALGTAMQNAGLAAPLFAELSTAIGGAVSNGVSDEEINQVLNNAYKKFQMIDQMESSIGSNLGGVFGKAGPGSSSATSEFAETIDFFERRVEVLDDALSHLKFSLDNVTGSFGKNNLIDAELGVTEEKFNNYTDALAMYTQKANEAFSKIPADIASTVKDGAVSLTEFIGDSNEDVVEAIKEYESWTDKITDCTQELEELKTAIRQLELEKFNNIMDDFSNQFDLRGDSKDLISKQIDLLKEAGELIGESFFTAQIDQSKKQLELLENEKAQLVNQLSSAINSGRIQAGTEEWLEMVNALSDVDGNILDCKKSIEEFDNSLLELHTEIFNRIQEQFSNLDSEISNILDLFDEFEVSDDKGIWSKESIAQLGLLAQQYELAQYQVQQYNNEIDELNKQYLAGRYSATEYADKLADLSSAQWDAVKSTESAKDSIMVLNETRIENQIKGIEKEIDAYRELADAQIDALKASKDLHDYENSIAEKTKSITDLERQIAAMQNDTSAATIAKRKKLEEQLAEAKKDLEETEYDHSIEVQEDALNKQYESYERERNEEIDALRESLNDKETVLAESFETVKENASVVGQEIATIATEHGITVSNALITSWQSGENAIASYGKVLSQSTSAFIQNIMSVENEVWNLQAQANTTADSLAWMFSAKADNLVNELYMSYYAETTLADMTNALQQSLVNTLERGYDASGIVNSLNSIADAADRAKRKIDSLNDSPTTPSVSTGFNDLDASRKYFIKDENSKTLFVGNPNQCQSWVSAHNYGLGSIVGDDINVIDNNKLKKYASGTRNAKEGLRVVNETGPELVLPKLPSGNYTVGNAGDQILTKVETDNIFGWAKLDPNNLIPINITDYMDNLRVMSMPQILPSNVNNNNNPVQIGNLINVQGSVNSSDLKQMESIANKAVDKLVNKIHDGIMYGT